MELIFLSLLIVGVVFYVGTIGIRRKLRIVHNPTILRRSALVVVVLFGLSMGLGLIVYFASSQ